ncbi:MAG TPA: DUF1579 domain-containing protein [Thermoanaerobaculia bacterium]
MRSKGILAGVALLVVIAALAIGADEKAKKAAPAGGMDEKAMMDAMAKYATPGEAHKKLEAFAGTWDTSVKWWMKPDAPATESKGTSENRMILGGRYLEQRFEGTMMDQPFTGIGYTGYDNYKKKYVGSWIDSMGTAMMNSLGTADASGKLTFISEMDDFMTGKKCEIKQVVSVVDNDHHVFEMWGPDPAGKVFKMMEIHYTRKK